MAMNQRDTERTNPNSVGRTPAENQRGRDTNPDPITGAPGSHPVGTGVGAAGGGMAGMAAGAAIGSVVPGLGTAIGAAVGAAVGATGGGLAGKGVAENINPSAEEAYWRQNYKSRPYGASSSYDELAPAYRYGWESRSRYAGRDFNDVEQDLSRDWSTARANSSLDWNRAKAPVRDAWDRVDRSATSDREAVL